MRRSLFMAFGIAICSLFAIASANRDTTAAPGDTEPMIVHNVYFSLAEMGPAARKKLVESCEKYLEDHPGVVYFSAGVVAHEFDRQVNDRDFDVALHLVFKNKAAHDAYQASEKHKQFIAEYGDSLRKVRVFDSKVTNSKLGKP